MSSTNPRPLPEGYKERGAPATGRILQTGSELQTNEFGLDVLARPYRVRTDMVEDLLPREGETDFQYTTLTFSKYRLTEEANCWSRLVIEYAGHVGGYRRKPTHECGRRRESIQLETDRKETVEVEYFAPYTVYRYVSNGEPRVTRFGGPIIFGPDTLHIDKERPASYRGKLQYRFRSVLEEWQGTPRGQYYEVTESWSLKLEPNDGRKRIVPFKWQVTGGPIGPF